MITAPDLADLLRALAPNELDQLAQDLSATFPGLFDQVQAASAELADNARSMPGDLIGRTLDSIPDPVIWQILEVLRRWHQGEVRRCMHSPDQRRPQPVFAAAWKPDLVVCSRCTHLLALPRRSKADRTCDLCGHECAGVEANDPIYPVTQLYGPLGFVYGACARCHEPAGPPLAGGHQSDSPRRANP